MELNLPVNCSASPIQDDDSWFDFSIFNFKFWFTLFFFIKIFSIKLARLYLWSSNIFLMYIKKVCLMNCLSLIFSLVLHMKEVISI